MAQSRQMLEWMALTALLAVLFLVATVMPSCQRASVANQARRMTTVATLACICTVLANQKSLPNSLSELTVASESHPALLTDVNLRDSWGQPILYRNTGETNFVLRSAGPDRQMGTRDDIF